MTARSIEVYLSGGASNTDPNLSLGGDISSTKLFGQTVSYTGTPIAGITLIDGAGISTGTLRLIAATKLLAYQKTGGAIPTAGQSVDVAVSGDYTIPCPELDQSVTVTIVSGSLPGTDTNSNISATSINQNLYDNVLAAEAEVGKIEYRHVYLKNKTASTVSSILFIKQNYTGLDYLEVGVYQLNSGHVDELLANDTTAPSGITFYSLVDLANGLTLSFAANEALGVYFRRTVTALTETDTPQDVAILSLATLV